MLRPEIRTFIGERIDGDHLEETRHFYPCPTCGQPVDKRDLAAVFHHEEPGHKPLPAEDAERLVRITAAIRRTLSGNTQEP